MNDDITFEPYVEKISNSDNSIKFIKFHQYYKGIKVDRHGYTLKVKEGHVIGASLNVNMELDIDVKNILSLNDRKKLHNCTNCKSELIISYEDSHDYSPRLQVSRHGSKEVFNAFTGEFLKKEVTTCSLNGATSHYSANEEMCDHQLIPPFATFSEGIHTMMTGSTKDESKIVIFNEKLKHSVPAE